MSLHSEPRLAKVLQPILGLDQTTACIGKSVLKNGVHWKIRIEKWCALDSCSHDPAYMKPRLQDQNYL
jgi:hypothetical protein